MYIIDIWLLCRIAAIRRLVYYKKNKKEKENGLYRRIKTH